jgi:hypothetical protein
MVRVRIWDRPVVDATAPETTNRQLQSHAAGVAVLAVSPPIVGDATGQGVSPLPAGNAMDQDGIGTNGRVPNKPFLEDS